jgi:mannose-6-phosphate isomerase-like protein (cupin superfamily)
MSPKLVFHAKDVMPFSPAGAEAAFESRLLIDASGVGSTDLAVNHFTLKPGHSTDPGAHPKPYDEVYYVLRGSGRVSLGNPPEHTDLAPDMVVFIPGGTRHALENTGAVDLEIITMMPHPMRAGVNGLYDERLRTWGTGFRLKDSTGA